MYIHKFIDRHKNIVHVLKVFLLFSTIYIIFFSPAIFFDKLLAPGDGTTQSIPAFYSPRILWTDLLYSGFPAAADPTVQHWYPLSLFSAIFDSWNFLVLSAYILASCFTYGYVYKITQAKFAAAVSGLIYGMSGFMMAHLGHTSMIHSAAWLPLIIWSLEELRCKFTIGWFLAGAGAIACSILAGHPQISVYSLALATFYVAIMGGNAVGGRWRYYRSFLALTVLGIALGAIQIIPTAELASLGLRPEMTYEEFISYSLPPSEAVKLFFPYVLGASHPVAWLYNIPYFGTGNFTEMTCYVGITTFILLFVGLSDRANKKTALFAKFWGFAALICFLLTLGNATPLPWIIYHVPVLKNFRVPARHFLEMTFALSILAGMGIDRITRGAFSRQQLLKIVGYLGGFIGILLIVIFLSKATILAEIEEKAGLEAARQFSLLPWSNPALGIPLLIFLIATIALIYLVKFPSNKTIKYLTLLLLIFDLVSFGWFCEWRNYSPSLDSLTPSVSVEKYAPILDNTHQRILPIRGGKASWDEIPANMSRLWGVPVATGYGPLILSRVNRLLSISTPGDVNKPNWKAEENRALDIMAIRYVFTPKDLSVVPEEDRDRESYFISEAELADSSRWEYVENIGRANIYENLRVQPRVWLVPEVVSLEPDAILKAIKSSNLPDGRTYEPSRMALVEADLNFNAKFDPQAVATISQLDDTHIQIKTSSNSPAFLVLSDIDYPGWRAKVDRQATRVFSTNYVLRGIVIPEGDRTVDFVFKPTSLHLGIGITAGALLLCVYLLVFYRNSRSK